MWLHISTTLCDFQVNSRYFQLPDIRYRTCNHLNHTQQKYPLFFFFRNLKLNFILRWPCILLLNYLLTPWCRVLLEKLTGLQLVKKFPAFHWTRMFITALTGVRHLSLSWASPFQSIYPHPTSWRSVLILSTHLRIGLPSGLFPHLITILANNQLDAQFLYMSLGKQLAIQLFSEWHIPEVVLIWLTLLMTSTWLLETCRELEETNIRKRIVRQVGYSQGLKLNIHLAG